MKHSSDFTGANIGTILCSFCAFVILFSGLLSKISQMPVVLIPVHFDRDPIDHIPSCQRSVVIRTFITNDFMTGVPATPGKQIPMEVFNVTSAPSILPLYMYF